MYLKDYIETTSVGIIFTFAAFLISPVLSSYINQFVNSEIMLSLIFSIYPLSIIIFSPMIGTISDKVGRKSIIRIGIALEICAFALYLLANNFILLLVARFFNAVAFSTVSIIILARINDLLEDKNRGTYSGIYLSLEKIGSLTAPLLGGFLADYYFVKMPFFIAIIVMSALLFFLFAHAKNKLFKVSIQEINISKGLKQFLKNRKLRGMAILGCVTHAINASYIVFLPLYILDNFELSYKYVGFAYFAFQFFKLFQFIFGKLADIFPRSIIVLVGTFGKGFLWFLIPIVPEYYQLVIVMLFAGIFSSMWNVGAWSLMSDIGERIKKQGSIMTSYLSIAKVGGFVSFIVSGFIVQLISIKALFMFNSILIIFGSIIASFFLIDFN